MRKIVVNMGVGEAVANPKAMDGAVSDLTAITGQKPLVTRATKIDRGLQTARGHADRREGDAARRAHVRVLRQIRQHRAAPHPRFPRHVAHVRSTAAATTRSASSEQLVFPEINYDKVDMRPRHGHRHRDERRTTTKRRSRFSLRWACRCARKGVAA